MAAAAVISTRPPFPANATPELVQQHIEDTLQYLLQECRTNLRQCNEAFIEKAFRFCVQAHSLDLRASGEPYYTHPAEVAAILAREVRLDDVSIAAALLHDVVEDTEYTLKDIREEFGEDVAAIVDGVTKISDVFKSHEVRQAASYRKLLLSMANDVRVILVKFADRLHNMRTLQFLSEQKQKRMAQETLDIYAPFAHRFGLGTIKWELEDLSFKYINREAYDQLKNALSTKRGEREDYIANFAQPIESRLTEYGLKADISGRAKHLYSIYHKMIKRGKSLDDIYDLFAIRVILDTDNVNDCFVVYGIVSDIYTPVPERFKNYISVPKKNGYQSLHTTVIGPDGKKVEVQIRTRSMHEIAERGVAAHFKYKERTNGSYVEDKDLEEWAQWVRDIFENAGDEASEQVFESFKLNLFQEEIYVFTPKGDLRILPKGATPVDFAFDIHSKVGYHCIGAKVNGKIVPLNYTLQSGDQVDILTSKNQSPSKDWERFVTTHKAKAAIRKFLNEENRKRAAEGREIWERKVKKLDVRVNDDDLEKLAAAFKFTHKGDLFAALGAGTLDVDVVAKVAEERFPANPAAKAKAAQTPPLSDKEKENGSITIDKFTSKARTESSVTLNGSGGTILYSYARCCNPVPGDDIVGVVTIGSGVKIHRRACKNIQSMAETMQPRFVEVNWSSQSESDGKFLAAIRITGEDRTAMLNDITAAIASYNNTNIRGVNIDSFDSIFEGVVTVYVKNTEHLERLFIKLRKIKGVKSVERFSE
ncbi:MAG: bifunctional (p)ppGpp synthetase/guanosine-3',5'-bis(diphosphate) 3'-pyrophosphohydrolase [Candidatus Kapabacteria bacterium]|jgi:RelA/SpoT family (p)ppGpp synthetase|nr:bifunctional (p)ppGpp synthetase/guanosine-3',5'-bis(diphosphate) 3'-pyrophosphohydrolase [Candidatus Kapabacteria bacterium]